MIDGTSLQQTQKHEHEHKSIYIFFLHNEKMDEIAFGMRMRGEQF